MPLLIALSILAAMFALAAVRNQFTGIVHWLLDAIAQVFEVPARGLLHFVQAAAGSIEGAYEALEAEYPDTHRGWLVTVPVLYAVLAGAIIEAERVVTSLRIQGVLGFSGGGSANEVGWLTGVAFIAVGTTAGLVLFDTLKLTPAATPFHKAEGRLQRILVILALGGLVLTILASGVLFVAGQRQHEGAATGLLSQIFALLFGLLIVLAAASALAVAIAGWHAIKIFALTLLRFVALAIHVLLRLAINVLDRTDRSIAAGIELLAKIGEILWNWICRFAWAERLQFRPLLYDSFPAIGSQVHESVLPSEIVPEQRRRDRPTGDSLESEGSTVLSARNIAILSQGSLGAALLPALWGGPTILAAGQVDPDSTRRVQQHRLRAPKAIKTLTPSSTELEAALGSGAATDTRLAVARLVGEKLVAAFVQAGVRDGYVVLVTDLDLVDEATEQLLRDLAARGLKSVVVTEEPQLEDREQSLAAIGRLTALWEADAVPITILVSPRAPFARALGPRAQEEHLAVALGSLVRGPFDLEANPSIVKVAEALSGSPFAALRIATRPTVPRKTVAWWNTVRKLVAAAPRGTCDLADATLQTARALTSALSEGDSSLLGDDPPTRRLIAVCTVPLRNDDPKFSEYVDAVTRASLHQAQDLSVTFASGNGAGAPDPATPYCVQVSILHQLGSLPTWATAEPERPEAATVRPRTRRSPAKPVVAVPAANPNGALP